MGPGMKRIVLMVLLGVAPLLATDAAAQSAGAQRGDYTDLAKLRLIRKTRIASKNCYSTKHLLSRISP